MTFFTRSMFAKAVDVPGADRARLLRLLDSLDEQIRAAFIEFLKDATSDELIAQAADLLEHGDVDGALQLIGPFIQRFANVMPQLFQEAASEEAQALESQIMPLRAGVAISFDPTNPEAAALMRSNSLSLVQGLTEQQAAATRASLAESLDTGQGFSAAGRALRNSIGLTEAQIRAVANYRRLLQTGSSLALDRQNRDMRFDPSVERAIDTGEPLSAEKIDRMVERYRMNTLATRATTIARTESVRMLSQAQQQAIRQTMATANVSRDDIEQTWNAVDDARTRFTHRILDGQVRRLGEPFRSVSGALLMYPGDPSAPAEEVINCRCHLGFRIVLAGQQRLA